MKDQVQIHPSIEPSNHVRFRTNTGSKFGESGHAARRPQRVAESLNMTLLTLSAITLVLVAVFYVDSYAESGASSRPSGLRGS